VHEDLDDPSVEPFLAAYFSDMSRWGFHVSIAFLLRALELAPLIRTKLTTSPVCQDWYFAEHYELYGHHMFEAGILTRQEFETCARLHRIVMRAARPPDVLVYLTAPPRVLLERIQRRGRHDEIAAIDEPYIAALVRRYHQWSSTVAVPMLRIDTARYLIRG